MKQEDREQEYREQKDMKQGAWNRRARNRIRGYREQKDRSSDQDDTVGVRMKY